MTRTKYKNEFNCTNCNHKNIVEVEFREGQDKKQIDYECETCGQHFKFILARDLKNLGSDKFPIAIKKDDDD